MIQNTTLIKNEVEQFIRNLESVRYYNFKLQDVNLRIEEVEVKLYEVGAINYEKDFSATGDPYANQKLGLMMVEEKLLKDKNYYTDKINTLRPILNSCSPEVKKGLINKYVLKKTWEDSAEEAGYSRRALEKKINKELIELIRVAFAT